MSLVTVIYIIAGLLPAIFLMWYIYKNDKLEKEPIPLLRKLAFGGVLAAFLALFLEQVFSHVMSQINFPDESTMIICEAIMIGASEEASKLFFLKRNTWRSPAFNFRYDGIVYAVFVSLGFAAIENVLYVFQYGLGVAISRGLLAVPAHMAFGVFMGSFYGRAKVAEIYGRDSEKILNLVLCYVVPVALHAFYDACAMLGSDMAMILFIAFVIVMYIIVIRKVRNESKTDYEF